VFNLTILLFILAWLKIYWLDVLVAAVFGAVVIWLLRRGKVDTVKQIMLYLVMRAERKLGSGTGPLKYASVIAGIYEYIPVILRLIFTKDELSQYLEEAVNKLETILKEPGTNLLTYEQEAPATQAKNIPKDE